MKAEDQIRQMIGTKSPYKVPDGYFEQLADRIIDQLPEREAMTPKVTLWQQAKPWVYMAAMFVGAFFLARTGRSYVTSEQNNIQETELATLMDQADEVVDDTYIISSMNTSCMDDYEVYTLMASE